MRVRATCTGISPYLMSPATSVLLEALRKRTPGGNRAPDRGTPEQEATAKLCREGGKPNGRLGIPSVNLLSCLVEAGRHVSYSGRTKLSTRDSTLVTAFIAIEESFLPFTGNPPWEVDQRKGTNPRGNEAVCIVRPRFDEWGFKVTLVFDPDDLRPEVVMDLLVKAGRLIGLGDFRPDKRGPYGRFCIEEEGWEVLPETATKKRTPPAAAKKTAKKTTRGRRPAA